MTSIAKLSIAMVAPPWFEVPPRGYGGTEWMCNWLVNGLVDRGHSVTLIGAGQDKTRARFIQTFGEPQTSRLGEPLPEVIHLARVQEILESRGFDIVHDHTLIGPLQSGGRQAPTIVTAHGLTAGEVGHYYRLLGDRVHLVAISESQRRSAPDLSWIGTVYNAVPVEDYTFVEKKEEFALFLGRMNPDKGVHVAIKAAKEAGIPLVIAAKCNEPNERHYLQTVIEPLLGKGTEYIGEADTEMKKDLLARARCLLFPIQWAEPFGIVMVEALASGTPVVAFRRGSVPEIVLEGYTGFVCDTDDELPAAIAKTASIDPRNCRKFAAENFGVTRMVEGYEAVYRRVLSMGLKVDITANDLAIPEVAEKQGPLPHNQGIA